MKKISLLMMTLIVAATMSAETIKVDTLTSADFGFDKLKNGYTELSYTSTVAGVAYKAQANGGTSCIQIRTDKSNSGVVSTTSGGYIKSVQIIQNAEKEAKEVQIYGSNTAFTAPTDLYDAAKSTKIGALTKLDQTFTLLENYRYIGVRSSSGARYLDKIIVTWTDTKPGTDPGTWTPDTISVSEACALIDKGDVHTHYIKGVVAGAPFLPKTGCYSVNLIDVKNPSDTLQAFTMRKGKATTEVYTSLEEMAKDFGLQDTVLIFADGISKFKSTYQTTSGYFVETIGKSAAIDAGKEFPYAYGAVQMEKVEGSYRYEIVLSKEDDVYDNALHYVIRTANEKGIAGTYSVYKDSSYVDGFGKVSGSLTIAYVGEGNPANTYSINGNITIGGSLYRFDNAQYDLAGYPDKDSDEPFQLVDDVPFVPQEGDTITCAQAASYAKSLGTSTGVKAYVRGFATGFSKIDGRTQQSFYMADDQSATQGIFQAYLCYTQNLDSIIKGDEVLVYGTISYFESKSQAQISKGKIYRIGGSDTKRPRNPQLEARPADAISVEQALAIGNALQAEVGATVETAEEYTVAGFIVDVNRQADKDSATWYMADVKGVYGDFEAYKCQIKSLICEDDEVYVTGKISKYQKSAEVANIEISKGKAGFISLASSLEEVVAAAKDIKSKKMLVNGQLYIVQDGVLYNAQGNVVR